MRDDDLVVAGELCDRGDGRRDVRALGLDAGRLAAAQQRIAAECDDHPHVLPALSVHANHEMRVLPCAG
jgi:hypothetical protein